MGAFYEDTITNAAGDVLKGVAVSLIDSGGNAVNLYSDYACATLIGTASQY